MDNEYNYFMQLLRDTLFGVVSSILRLKTIRRRLTFKNCNTACCREHMKSRRGRVGVPGRLKQQKDGPEICRDLVMTVSRSKIR